MKRWFKYVKPYLPYFILGPIGMIVEVIGEMLMPQLLGTFCLRRNCKVTCWWVRVEGD